MLGVVLGALALLMGGVGGMLAADAPARVGAESVGGDSVGAEWAPGEILASFFEPPSAERLLGLGLTLIDHAAASNVTRLRGGEADPTAALARLRASGLVAWAEPNQRLRVAELIPDDPRYGEQADVWELLGAPAAWEITTGSRSVVVAVIDGAIDLDHPDLVSNIWTNAGEIPGNGIDDDENGYVDDVHGYDFLGDFPGGTGVPQEDNDPDVKVDDVAAGDGIDQDGDGIADGAVGHGTRVAGVIAARGNDGLGVPGTAWRVQIMAVRVTDPEGSGFFSSFVRALEYATANGADIINISLASTFLPESARAAVEAAYSAGVVLVGAGGNSGGDVAFPAAMPEIIAVGSHGDGDNVDARASFSPRGAGVALVAPGRAVLTTDVRAESAEADYARATGTSFSAPFVSGTLALALSLEPGLDQAALLDLLRETATPLPEGTTPGWAGAGRLNMAALLVLVRGAPPGPPVLETIDLEGPDSDFLVRGQARPGSLVALRETSTDTALGTGVADADGRFAIGVAQAQIPERQAWVTLAAVADRDGQVSALSDAARFALPRLVVLQPGWNLVAWAAATASGSVVVAGLPAGVARVFAWDGRGWELAVPGDPRFAIDLVTTGEGLWLLVSGGEPVSWLQRRAEVPERRLTAGWHLLAWAGDSGPTAEVAGTGLDALEALYLWDVAVAEYRAFAPSAQAGSTLDAVAHLDALWVFVAGGQLIWPGS